MELTDSRRLTGANLFWDHPSAIIDVSIEGGAEEVPLDRRICTEVYAAPGGMICLVGRRD